jgi:hypothetical protein
MHKIIDSNIYSISNFVHNKKYNLNKDNIFHNLKEDLITEPLQLLKIGKHINQLL